MSARLPARCGTLPPDTPEFRPRVFQATLQRILARRMLAITLLPVALLAVASVIWTAQDLSLVNNWPVPGGGAVPDGVGWGVIAFGGGAVGLLAIGGGAVGLVAVGGMAIGVVAIGGSAIGLFAFGGGAVGLFGAVGGGAVGLRALGGGAVGRFILAGDGAGEHRLTLRAQDEVAVEYWCALYPELREAFPARWPDLPRNRAYLAGPFEGGGAAAAASPSRGA